MERDWPVHILIADDLEAWRTCIRSMLEERPQWQAISEAGDGQQAVDTATKLRPEIVLLDIGMPVLNGIEAAKRIREVSPDSKIIFVTKDGDGDVRDAALATGGSRVSGEGRDCEQTCTRDRSCSKGSIRSSGSGR